MKHNTMIRPRTYYVGAAVLLLVGLVIGLGLSTGFDLPRFSTAARGTLAAVTSNAPVPDSPFVSVVERALPAVVFIDVKKKLSAGPTDDPQDELFRRFFGDLPRQRMRETPTSGSGFIIDRAGYILTNNHVVRDADQITVTLNDKRDFKARVVGADPETDVAVIKIDGDDLPALPLGDSDQIRVGDWAIAIGNPLGVLRGSVTVGIISARGRSDLQIFGGTPQFQDFIQTDASINFGNSGGPLCNIRGEAIGINTAINQSGQGIGFAIPINLAKHVADQLVAHGQVKRAWLGVQLADLTPEIAEGFGIQGAKGVLIASVLKDTPADRAGLRRNDLIVEFNGQPVSDMQKFRLKVADTPSGTRVPVAVMRDGKRLMFTVTLADRAAQAQVQAQSAEPSTRETLGGLTVRELTPDEKANSGLETGVMVTDVQDGSPADDAGIQASDVIQEVNRQPVASAAAFAKALREARDRGRPAVLFVNRGGNTQYVTLRLSK